MASPPFPFPKEAAPYPRQPATQQGFRGAQTSQWPVKAFPGLTTHIPEPGEFCEESRGAPALLPGPVPCHKGPGPAETRLFQLWNTNQPPSALPFARTKFMSL